MSMVRIYLMIPRSVTIRTSELVFCLAGLCTNFGLSPVQERDLILICFLMFAFPEQLPAEIDAIRDLTREFSNLPTAINIKIFKKSRKENLGGGKRECQDSWTLGLKDEYYLGPFFSPVFDWLNLLVGKRILKSNKYSRFLTFSWFEFFKSLTVWLVIQHEYKQNEMTWDQSTGRLTIGTESTERKMQQEIKGKF